MLRSFAVKNSIRRKIILPFLIIMILMMFFTFFISSYFLIHIQKEGLQNKLLQQAQSSVIQSETSFLTFEPESGSRVDDDGGGKLYFLVGDDNGVFTALFEPESLIGKPDFQQVLNGQASAFNNRPVNNFFMQRVGRQYMFSVFYRLTLEPNFVVCAWETIPLASLTVMKLLGSLFAMFIIIGLVFLGIFSMIVRNLTAAIDIFSTVAHRVANGDLDQKVYLKQQDEIGDLANIFNTMTFNLKESSREILFERDRSEAIVSCLPDGIIVTDMDHNLILANPRAEKMFKFSAQELVGKHLADYIQDENLIDQLENKKISAENDVVAREITFQNDDNQTLIYELKSSFAQTSDSRPIGIITTLRDITHDRELEELREGFLRTVSHELRTPLTSIIGFLELLDFQHNKGIDDQSRKSLEIVYSQANHLKCLIEDLLELSRINAGEVAIIYIEVNIQELLSTVAQSFQILTKRKGLDFVIGPIDPSLTVEADVGSLRRILINLISNAVKFTDKGHICVNVEADETNITFSVEDTGIGLMEDERDVIFQKFRQVDYSSTRRYEGIGLGLSIVKQLLELHDGTITVDSTYGKGSTFSFTIPIRQTKTPVQIGFETTQQTS